MRKRAVVIGCPFVEMIGDVVSCCVSRCVFEIDDDDLVKEVPI